MFDGAALLGRFLPRLGPPLGAASFCLGPDPVEDALDLHGRDARSPLAR